MHVQKGPNDVTLPPTPPQPPDGEGELASLDELMDTEVDSDEARSARRDRASATGQPKRRKGVNWPRLAERILGRLAPTLHQAIVAMTLVVAGFACIVAMWGGYGVICVILLCALLRSALTKLSVPATA
jgi:hypothetical protein